MRIHICILILLLAAVMSSCSAGSMNVQRSGLRSVGDLSVTVLLDKTSEANIEKNKERIKKVLETIRTLVTSDDLTALTRTKFTTKLLKKIPAQYASWTRSVIDTALLSVESHTQIDADDRRRIMAFVNGSFQAIDSYSTDDRAKPE